MERCRRNLPDCPAKLTKGGCRIVMHHIFFPGNKYTGGLEEEFRDLDINRVPMCAGEEVMLHQHNREGPPKPTLEVMEYCVDQERLRRELAVRPIRRP